MNRVINMWAAPRNVSTAMMYAWNQRSDTTVIDEPMYAHFLTVTELDHPVRDDVLRALPVDEGDVVSLMLSQPPDTPLLFIKNMAHHLEGMDPGFIDEMDNFFLTRDPRHMLPSLGRGLERTPTMRDAGYGSQIEILDQILESGRTPIVVDSRTLLDAPESTLASLCRALEVPFDPAMLSWSAGPKEVDGVWGRHWYKRLHQTTGFEAYVPDEVELADDLELLYEDCAPMYQRLLRYAVG